MASPGGGPIAEYPSSALYGAPSVRTDLLSSQHGLSETLWFFGDPPTPSGGQCRAERQAAPGGVEAVLLWGNRFRYRVPLRRTIGEFSA